MTGTDWLLLVVIVAFYATSAFLAMSETSLTSMTKVKAITLAEEGRTGARRLERITEEKERYLNPVLLLVLMCQISGSTLAGILLDHHFSGWGVVVGTVLQVLLVFVLSESMPKTWAVLNPERSALRAAPVVTAIVALPPIRFVTRALITLSNILLPGKGRPGGPAVSEEDLRASADVAESEGAIESDERTLIHNIFELGDTAVREVMTPRPDMVTAEGRTRVSDAVEVALASGYSRLPVTGLGIDNILGVVFTRDLLRAEREGGGDDPISRHVVPAHVVPETKKVSELMREMQRDKFHIAVVVDEYGGTAGLVTLEDLIEELVGEIVDEHDLEEDNPPVERLPDGDYRLDAGLPVDEANDALGEDVVPEGDWDTVGGFVLSELGHVPEEGEFVVFDGHMITAEKVQGNRISCVRVSRTRPPEEDELADVG